MLDCNGKRLKVGDIVELVDIPLEFIGGIGNHQRRGVILRIVREIVAPNHHYLLLDNDKINGFYTYRFRKIVPLVKEKL